MTNDEKKKLEQEYENLKLLVHYHSTYEVIESNKEREKMINEILDCMNKIKDKLETE